MSFKTASAILRGRWLIDKAWADAHMPLVFAVLKGDAKAASLLGLDDDEDENDDEVKKIGNKVYQVYPGCKLSDLPDGSIAYVDIDGPLLKQGGMCSYGMEDYSELFYGLQTAANIEGVIVDIDSPGGQADGTATLADAIAACAAVKPVVGFIDDGLAASAAYWAISACSEVYCCQPTDAVGSVGVYTTVADVYAYYQAQGLPVKDVYAPQSTDKNLDYRESIQGNDDLLKAELKVIADAFIAAVRKNRKGKISGNDWATGKMFFAADAQKIGLIDGIKSFDQVVFRTSRMISSNKKNSNTMAFEKALATAKAEAFEVVEGGFLLSEENLNSIEATLAANETAVAAHATEVEALGGQIISLNEQLTAANEATNAGVATITEREEEIGRLNARIATLEASTDEPTTTAREKDDTGADKTPYHAKAENPMNQWADSVMPPKKA